MRFLPTWGRRMVDLSLILRAWGLQDAPCQLVATRENTVYRVQTAAGVAALRLRRPGYRCAASLRSELDWMAALAGGGLPVPAPLAMRGGGLLAEQDGVMADLVTWIDGTPMGVDGALTAQVTPDAYHALGAQAARLHDLCDAWTPPPGFTRPAWDADGLLGEAPLWGRFWDNPDLTGDQRRVIVYAKDWAQDALGGLKGADYGLIHADLTPENVILTADGPALIDFDDGGWGFRGFELATIIARAERAPDPAPLIDALLAGYRSRRAFDTEPLPLFLLLRAFSYLGWVMPRLAEPGAAARAARFVDRAVALAETVTRPVTPSKGG